jgi:S1-C subfamily serine protease
MWYLWGALIGLGLALVFLLIFYKVFYPDLSRDAQLATIDPGVLQQSNIDALPAEIDAYRAALAGDVCLAPPLADSAPLFRPRETPGGGSGAPGDGANAAPAPLNPSAGDAIESATVLVLAEGQGVLDSGTGFFINERQVLTNRHVVSKAIRGGMVIITSKSLGRVVGAHVKAVTSGNEVARDYAVLEITDSVPHGKLRFQPQAQRMERVGAWGYPGLNTESDPQMKALLGGNFNTAPEVVYSEGVISVVQRGSGSPSVISHTAEISQGNSGGPLVNVSGDVLGINTAIRPDRESNRQVNMSLGADDIIQFLRSNGIAFDLANTA